MSADTPTPEPTEDYRTHPVYHRYAADRDGNVWTLFYNYMGLGDRRLGSPRMLRKKMDRGYASVCITHNGAKFTRRVNRFVLECFSGIGPRGYQAAHKNGVRSDNRPDNLEWKTPRDNSLDKRSHGTMIHGEKMHSAKMTWAKVKELRSLAYRGVKTKELMARFGMSRTVTQYIKAGKTWAYQDAAMQQEANS